MIKIRTITYNMPKEFGDDELKEIAVACNRWNNNKYEVHTQRINLPIYDVISSDLIERVSLFCSSAGIRWFGIPIDPERTKCDGISIERILSLYKNAFVNMICAKNNKLSDSVVSTISRQFLQNTKSDKEGLVGFRFGASNNVMPNGPFFPFTYSDGNHIGFSIGLELAEEINSICKEDFNTIIDFKQKIVDVLKPQFSEIEATATRIAALSGLSFDGIDFSLAPLPEQKSSVIPILRKIGIDNINDTGMLFATAFLTKMLKSFALDYKSVGFSGVMYSLLEDSEYAEINRCQEFSINNMIALSTMCGCGVDMVPIPIGTTEDMIRSILLEIACVSSRLHKPLGVRLLPVEDVGDHYTHFTEETDFVINTRIVEVKGNQIGHFDDIYEY